MNPIHTTTSDRPGELPTVVVACLAGNGIGPEVTAAASRALNHVSRSHGFRVEEVHPPFDGEALVRSGHPLPAATRRATLGADAILVAGATAPALDGVCSELDLAARVMRLVGEPGEAILFAPCAATTADWTVDRAFASARARTGRLVSVGVSAEWRALVDARNGGQGVEVEHRALADALRLLAEEPVGTFAVEHSVADAVLQAPRLGGRSFLAATGDLSATGPGVFAPTHGTAHDDAGQGVVDPSEMLLATALMLTEGVGRRAAGEALEESLVLALQRPQRPGGVAGAGVAATTREFVDAVVGLLPSARRDTEFAMGVSR